MRHAPRRRQAHPPAHGLDEPDGGTGDFWLRSDVGKLDRRKSDGSRSDADGGGADVAPAKVAVIDDLAVIDLDETAKLVRLPEAIALPNASKSTSRSGGGSSYGVTPSSNGIFAGPVIASDGIQDTAVTDDSKRWTDTAGSLAVSGA